MMRAMSGILIRKMRFGTALQRKKGNEIHNFVVVNHERIAKILFYLAIRQIRIQFIP